MKEILLNNWTFSRWLRLGLSIYFIYLAFAEKQMIFGFIGLLLSLQTIFNTGCSSAGCAPRNYYQYDKSDDIEPEFDIVKPK